MTNPRRLFSTEIVPDYAKADFNKLKQCMSINWASELSDVGAQIAWTVLKTKLRNPWMIGYQPRSDDLAINLSG